MMGLRFLRGHSHSLHSNVSLSNSSPRIVFSLPLPVEGETQRRRRRRKGGWGWVKLVEVQQEGFHGNKGLRLPRRGRQGLLGIPWWYRGPCEESQAEWGLRSPCTPHGDQGSSGCLSSLLLPPWGAAAPSVLKTGCPSKLFLLPLKTEGPPPLSPQDDKCLVFTKKSLRTKFLESVSLISDPFP